MNFLFEENKINFKKRNFERKIKINGCPCMGSSLEASMMGSTICNYMISYFFYLHVTIIKHKKVPKGGPKPLNNQPY